jgi:hypothetical protein
MQNTDLNLKPLTWKYGVMAPPDAKRPTCRVLYSLDGVTGKPAEDQTDLVDWLIVIAYETEGK